MTARARILAYLHTHGPATTLELAAMLDLHPDTVRRNLRDMWARCVGRRGCARLWGAP